MEENIRRSSYNEFRKQSIHSSITNTHSKPNQLQLQKRRFTTAGPNEIGLSSSAINNLKKIFEKNVIPETSTTSLKSRYILINYNFTCTTLNELYPSN